MWEKLKITHDGTNEVKKTRTDNFEKFNNFKMQDDEKIEEMFDRFGKITHELYLMGVVYDHEKIVRKVLKNLTAPWKIKETKIEELGKTATITTDELRGKLIAYEKTYLRKEVEEIKKRKEKGIALKM